MTTDDPMTTLIGPDGLIITDPGAPPALGPGGDHGRPSRDDQGRKCCCRCYRLLKPADGRSVYCRPCKDEATNAAVARRNAKRKEAEARRNDLRQATHWEGDGYIRGREGLYLDQDTVREITHSYGAALASYVDWVRLARNPYDPEQGRAYHRALREMLRPIKNLSAVLRAPLFPETDRRSRHEGDKS